MRALVLGASLLVAALGAAAPAAQAQVILPPPPIVPSPPIGTSAPPPYGYASTPLGIAGSLPPYGSDGQPSSSLCTDPQTGQQLIIPTANVFAAIAGNCVRMGPGQ
ncbi:MAG TPA: hypothetical protein VFE37_24785 [Chloroflexota bacterium]|nr:hypothetical protein [Chloroflexota bacterium]